MCTLYLPLRPPLADRIGRGRITFERSCAAEPVAVAVAVAVAVVSLEPVSPGRFGAGLGLRWRLERRCGAGWASACGVGIPGGPGNPRNGKNRSARRCRCCGCQPRCGLTVEKRLVGQRLPKPRSKPAWLIVVLGDTNSALIERGSSLFGLGLDASESVDFKPTHLNRSAYTTVWCSLDGERGLTFNLAAAVR